MSCICNVVCVVLQWNESNEEQILLRNMDFDASGLYCCEVSTQTPIYTKLSNDHELTVIRKYTRDGGSTRVVYSQILALPERVRYLLNTTSLRICVFS